MAALANDQHEQLVRLLKEWQKSARWQDHDRRYQQWLDDTNQLRHDKAFRQQYPELLPDGRETQDHLDCNVQQSRKLYDAYHAEHQEIWRLLDSLVAPDLLNKFERIITNNLALPPNDRANAIGAILDELLKRSAVQSTPENPFTSLNGLLLEIIRDAWQVNQRFEAGETRHALFLSTRERDDAHVRRWSELRAVIEKWLPAFQPLIEPVAKVLSELDDAIIAVVRWQPTSDSETGERPSEPSFIKLDTGITRLEQATHPLANFANYFNGSAALAATQNNSGPAPNLTPEQSPNTIKKKGTIADAIGLLTQHPGWTNAQISEAVGLHPKSLSNSDTFKAARRAAKESGKSTLRISKNRGNDMDEYEAST